MAFLRQLFCHDYGLAPLLIFNFANGFVTIFIKSMHQENEFSDVRLAMHALYQSLQRDGALANVDLIKLTAFAMISNFAFENGFAFAMITKSDFIAIDNEKCFHSSLRLHKLLISKLDVLKIHIRSLRSAR